MRTLRSPLARRATPRRCRLQAVAGARRFRAGALALAVALCGPKPAGAQQSPAPAVQAAAASATPATPGAAQPPSPGQVAEFSRAQRAARSILARDEFQQAEPTWWDRLTAQLRNLLARMFLGVDRLTTSAPWLGRLLEWVLFTAAAVGLLVWVLRTVQRQRLRMALGETAHAVTEWTRETEDWRRLADEQAANGAWREAIHALYWAAIVHLERRRAWRHNPARTPREYVRLLRPGSPEQRELRGLTGALEQSWYGQRAAAAEDYGQARASFERLSSGAETAIGLAEQSSGGGA